jgi:hypothetical protein
VIKLLSRAACAVLVVAAAAAVAQTPPAGRDELEPGVNTSAPASAPAPAPANEESTAPASDEPPAQSPPAARTPAAAGGTAPTATPNKPAGRSNARDRLDLDATQITGNRELPKVLYIVPWRGAELGDLVGRPVNSLLDEVLEPVDRDVFRRQNRYFEALQPNEAAPAGKPEK